MATIRANGTIIGDVQYLTYVARYMSNRVVLRNSGDGWKRYGVIKDRFKTPQEAYEYQLEFKKRVDEKNPHLAAYRNAMIKEFPRIAVRAKAVMLFDMLPEDPDGCWSELQDLKQLLTFEEVQELLRLRKEECDEAKILYRASGGERNEA